jgi:hypothetical protein
MHPKAQQMKRFGQSMKTYHRRLRYARERGRDESFWIRPIDPRLHYTEEDWNWGVLQQYVNNESWKYAWGIYPYYNEE